MERFSIGINQLDGGILHVKTAGLLMKEAAQYMSSIKVTKNEKTVDAKDILAWLGLKIVVGDTINVEITGPDEEAAAANLKEFFTKNFN